MNETQRERAKLVARIASLEEQNAALIKVVSIEAPADADLGFQLGWGTAMAVVKKHLAKQEA